MKSLPPARRWLRQLLLQLCSMAMADAHRAGTNRTVAIHALRVRMKKMTALLKLAADEPKETSLGPVITHLRRIKQGVAGGRDAQVIRRTATKLAPGGLPLLPIKRRAEWTTARLIHETEVVHAMLQAVKLDPLKWPDVLRRHTQAYRRARKGLLRCHENPQSQNFHRWRKRVKEFYYQALALHHFKPCRKLAGPALQLGHDLGRAHDLLLVMQQLDASKDGLKWKRKLAKQIHKSHDNLLSQGLNLFARKPGWFAKSLGSAK